MRELEVLISELKAPVDRAISLVRYSDPRLAIPQLFPNYAERIAAALVLIYPHRGELHTALIKRVEHLACPGEVQFPGGTREGKERYVDVALRETGEELGFNPAAVKVSGRLTPFLNVVEEFWIVPYLGYLESRPDFKPDFAEVSSIIEVPLRKLLEAKLENVSIYRNAQNFVTPSFKINTHRILGGASIMIGELQEILGLHAFMFRNAA